MKYVVCVPDGCSDLPVADLGGKTPLEVAETPVLDELAKRGTLGRAMVIPEGMPPGSDVGNMSIFGYDPGLYHTGRAPIESAAMGIKLQPDQAAFRCNLVEVDTKNEIMLDFAGGHPDNDLAGEAVATLNRELGNGELSNGDDDSPIFHPGVQYRHITVLPKSFADVQCAPPHDISDKPLVWPEGQRAEELKTLMLKSREVLADFKELSANQIWLWGQGSAPDLPAFNEVYGKRAGLVTAVDLVRGLGVLTKMDIVEVPGATAWYDTNYEGKRDAVLKGLEEGADLFILHVEASDEAGHAGDTEEKVKCLANWDSRILEGLIEGLDDMGDWRLLLLPDHATPLELRTHIPDPVPYLIVDSKSIPDKTSDNKYNEDFVKDAPMVEGYRLMAELLQKS